MKRKITLRAFAVLAVLSCSILFMACANQGQEQAGEATDKPAEIKATTQTATTETPAAQEEAAAAPARKSSDAAKYPLYTDTPRSLTPVECAACHKGQYVRLQNSGSKHRFDCLNCHTQLHANIPSKDNYRDILPKCVNCHKLFHGEAFPTCSQCHQDPHTPLDIPFSGVKKTMKNQEGKDVVSCEVCHWDSEGKEMATYPNKHNTNVGCTGCHGDEKHGVRPTCFKCHKPHVEGQTYADCLICHRPHSAKKILPYPKETPNKICGSCHTDIFNLLQTNVTKHTAVQCADCHLTHGQIPKCQRCHGEPHGPAVHKRFPNCLECHVDPHNLPVNPGK